MLSAVTLLLRWSLGWLLGARSRPLPHAEERATAGSRAGEPKISVLIPARNEAESLPHLLTALASQHGAPFEIIVANDHSDDVTASIATASGADVFDVPALPVGWTGKTWACWNTALRSSGEVLVFLDADTVPGPDLIQSLVAAQRRAGGLVSVQPRHTMRRVYERASALFNVIAVMGVGVRNAVRRPRIIGAFGPCVAVGRADYFALDGHRAVAGEVLEDLCLAETFARAGHAVSAYEGGRAIEFRMYPNGFRPLVEGWSKNFAAGAGSIPRLRFLAVVAWVSGLIEAGWWTVGGLVSLPFDRAISWWHVGFYMLFAAQLAWMLRSLGNFGWSAILHPLLVATFVVVFFRSVVLLLRGTVTWKGRTIPTRVRTRAAAERAQ